MKYKVSFSTVQVFSVEIEAESKEKAVDLAWQIEPDSNKWAEEIDAGGGWEFESCVKADK